MKANHGETTFIQAFIFSYRASVDMCSFIDLVSVSVIHAILCPQNGFLLHFSKPSAFDEYMLCYFANYQPHFTQVTGNKTKEKSPFKPFELFSSQMQPKEWLVPHTGFPKCFCIYIKAGSSPFSSKSRKEWQDAALPRRETR